MRKREMRDMLLRKTGAGVKVTTITGTVTYLFFESDSYENAVKTAKLRFRRGEKLDFYSTARARKEHFEECMVRLNNLYEQAWKDPDNDYGFDAWNSYKDFLIRTLMDWTGCSKFFATVQVDTKIIFYSRFKNDIYTIFKGSVAA